MKFEKGFLMGTSTAAHQVEGNNIHSDCWALEQMKHTSYSEPSGDTVDHYNRYEEDIRLMAGVGLNAYRFSIEWARIEPQKGRYEQAEIEHYRRVIRCCKQNGLEPIVTLHHFSSPKWLISEGGWEAETTVEAFKKYCVYVAEQLGGELSYVCTINEANMGLQIAAIAKRHMQQMQKAAAVKQAEGSVQMGLNLEALMAARQEAALEEMQVFGTDEPGRVYIFQSPRSEAGDQLIMRAHQVARDAMKAICPHLKIGVTLSLHDIQAQPGGEQEAARLWAEEFTHYLPYIENDDFLGVQNYTRTQVGPGGRLPVPDDAECTQSGYEFYPEALEHVIRKVAEGFKGELIVTENGVATEDDTRRVEFIRRALAGVSACIADGLPVKGYCYWSLMDNFEWQKGYSMTFGLIAVDRAGGQVRKPKPSLSYLGSFVGKE